jgi:hypothetical protein
MSLFKVGLFTLLDPHESTLQTQAHSGWMSKCINN